jgi:hypothetical protein
MTPPDAQRPTSARVAIARLAGAVIAADPGIGPTDGGGRWVTPDGDVVVPGVVVAAADGGGFDVALHLVAYLPPRPVEEQAASLRAALLAVTRRAGVTDRLGQIDVAIHDLRERGAEEGVS